MRRVLDEREQEKKPNPDRTATVRPARSSRCFRKLFQFSLLLESWHAGLNDGWTSWLNIHPFRLTRTVQSSWFTTFFLANVPYTSSQPGSLCRADGCSEPPAYPSAIKLACRAACSTSRFRPFLAGTLSNERFITTAKLQRRSVCLSSP